MGGVTSIFKKNDVKKLLREIGGDVKITFGQVDASTSNEAIFDTNSIIMEDGLESIRKTRRASNRK